MRKSLLAILAVSSLVFVRLFLLPILKIIWIFSMIT
ncbi:Uncharacterised protein [Salmonella enterica subsp. enterica]|uniref:Uncharacterized protein n=1 Tax=Salmonella enterica I TaxID=59201 RepID=A0A447MZ46_SALET|nr:Uncharacterised protein [Salmonella enterica subsp. enterica]